MADQSDVEAVLVSLVSAALYPNGTDNPSVPGPLCRVYRGWPKPAALNADLAAGRINVTVFPEGEGIRNTTRYPVDWTATPVVPTLTASVANTTVTFDGLATSGQVAGVLVDGRSYAYRTTTTDTPASVAANIAVAARADGIVTLSGAAVTFQGAGELLARVVADATGVTELRRQLQRFRIICWCSTPLLRDVTVAAIDAALATMPFISLPDGTSARVVFSGTTVFDQSQEATLYRRDLLYSVEYATTATASLPSMLFGSLGLNAAKFIA
jgi:hypothetical protein